jgi:hypothetical protein
LAKRKTLTASEAQPTQQDIAIVAYNRYEQRGCVDGHDLDDWFHAENELKETFASAATPIVTGARHQLR